MTRTRNTCLALLSVLASPMAAADLIWDFRIFGATGQLSTNDGVDHSYEILGFETLLSSSRDMPVADWTILSGGGFSFVSDVPGRNDAAFRWNTLEVEAPMYIDTLLYGSSVLLPVTQKLYIDDFGGYRAAFPNSEPGANVRWIDNTAIRWSECAQEWSWQIERGDGPHPCLENGGTGGSIFPIYFPFTLDLNPVSVPEPGTFALLSLGLLGMAARRKKKA